MPVAKAAVLSELIQPVDAPSVSNEPEVDKPEADFAIPKTEPPPPAKPINRARINEFASLLSASVHLTPPQAIKPAAASKSVPAVARPVTSPARSEDQSFSSIPSASSDREERESYHTVQSNHSEQPDAVKKHIDARYNEKLDDRGSIKIKTANIKALFEQKISDTNRALSQSNEHLQHLSEARQQQQQQQQQLSHHRKIPVSYDILKRNLPVSSPQPQATLPVNTRRQSYQDSSSMNRYADHHMGTKDVVIEDKQVGRD